MIKRSLGILLLLTLLGGSFHCLADSQKVVVVEKFVNTG